jgi:LacI family transcriptional regulator
MNALSVRIKILNRCYGGGGLSVPRQRCQTFSVNVDILLDEGNVVSVKWFERDQRGGRNAVGMSVKRATIIDVAKVAKVSWKTVSRVINGEPNVRAATEERVRAAIDQIGYVPDTAARSLAGSRAFTIGILFDNPSPNYTMKVQTGAYEACRAHGYHLLIENLDSAADDVADQMRAMLLNTRVDGFVLTPPITECAPVMDVLEERGIPFARIAPVSFPDRSPSYSIDDGAAAAEIARHLWAIGHRRFGLVTGPAKHGAAGTRRDGFLSALAELGCTETVLESYGGFAFEFGIAAGLELLSRSDRPTAIFAMNDDSAAGVMSAAAQLGLHVPGDVAVAGFDDSWVAKSVWPYLTTIYQPITEMAQQATKLLIERAPPGEANGNHRLDYALKARGSTGTSRFMPASS